MKAPTRETSTFSDKKLVKLLFVLEILEVGIWGNGDLEQIFDEMCSLCLLWMLSGFMEHSSGFKEVEELQFFDDFKFWKCEGGEHGENVFIEPILDEEAINQSRRLPIQNPGTGYG